MIIDVHLSIRPVISVRSLYHYKYNVVLLTVVSRVQYCSNERKQDD